jgi:small subunit ribosomal protein S16
MLKMRLQRIGRKNNPSYRLIVTDSRNAASRGRSVDLLGSYEPKLGTIIIDKEKAKHWISKGVQPSDTVYNMLVAQGVIEGRKKNVLPKKSPIIDEAKLKAEAEAKEKAEADAKAAKEAEEAAKAAAEATPEAEPEVPAEEPKSEEVAA